MSDDPILVALACLRTEFLAELGKTRTEIMDRIDRQQARLDSIDAHITEIRDDIAVNMGAVEQMDRINETTRSDLRQMREQMSVMWKQLKQAQQDIRDLRGEP